MSAHSSIIADIVFLDEGKQRHGTPITAAGAAGLDEAPDSNPTADFLIGSAVHDAGDCCRQPFDVSLVAAGLSQLGRSASGEHQVYQRLQVTHTDLQDPQAVAHCQHIQQLVLAGNCLTTLQPLSCLQHLTSLDVSHNRLTQVLDYSSGTSIAHTTSSSSSSRIMSGCGHGTPVPPACSSSNLRRADLSYNAISQISSLAQHSALQELLLAGNQITRISSGLEPLKRLRRLDLSSNRLSSCQGLQGLCSLQELCLDGNKLSGLQPLSSLTALQALSAAHNQISQLDGVEGLSCLRVLDVGGNQLRRMEALAALQQLSLLTSLNLCGNPLEAAQDARLHVVGLLMQLQQLNGVEVAVRDKVEAANILGAATDGLVLIRRRFFPAGELEEGGGAVPPTAAGLKASQAGEEGSCGDPAAMFAAIDGWARSVQPGLALQPVSASTGLGGAARTTSLPAHTAAAAAAAAAAVSAGLSRGSSAGLASARMPSAGSLPPVAQPGGVGSRRGSSAGRANDNSSSGGAGAGVLTRPGSGSVDGVQLRSCPAAKQAPAQPGGIAAIAARLAAGCCPEAPYRQLQLLRACHCWVLTHVRLPRECDLEAGADAVTWDVGRHLFGEAEGQVLLHEVLLSGYSGTWAECVCQLLVRLLRGVHLEAQQLSGFWKAGGQGSAQPGQQLASHNHSWVSAKVNGCWRLLDPVAAIIMASRDQPLPFFLPPEAFIHTHLPFEPCWQLLPQPVRAEEWWGRPELCLGFAAAGGRFMDGGRLRACMVMQLDKEVQTLPTLNIPIAAPANPQQRLCIRLLDHDRQLLACWQPHAPPLDPSTTTAGASQGVEGAADAARQNKQRQVVGSCSSSGTSERAAEGRPLVFQQRVLGAAGLLRAQIGSREGRATSGGGDGAQQVEVQELWVAFPGPGTYHVQVDQVTEVPGGLLPVVAVGGLAQPLSLTLRQNQLLLQLKVVVEPPAVEGAAAAAACGQASGQLDADCSSSGSGSSSTCRPLVAYLPEPPPAFFAAASSSDDPNSSQHGAVPLQLLSPQPGALLEADREQDFRVLVPAGVTAALAVGCNQSGWVQLQQQQLGDSAAAAAVGAAFCEFAGSLVLPRVDTCYLAVRAAAAAEEGDDSECAWTPVLGLHVRPPAQDLVVSVPEPLVGAAAAAGDAASPIASSAAHLLSALDVDCDGGVSRRDMLRAFRRDRQLADHLRVPAKIRAGDSTFDTFLAKFIAINSSGLGYVSCQELSAYLASLAAASRGSSSSSNRAGSSGSSGSSRVPTAAAGSRVTTAAAASSRMASAAAQRLPAPGSAPKSPAV